MNTRTSRSRAKRANVTNDDSPIEVIDVFEPKKRKQGPEIITLDEDDVIKTKVASIKPEVECIYDDDVITLEDEEEEILCLEEVKTVPAPATKPARSKVSSGSGSEKTGKKENVVTLEEPSKPVTRRQKALQAANASSTKTVDSNASKTVEPMREENRKNVAQSANKDSSPKEPEGVVLKKKQRAVGPATEARESSPARRARDKAKERSEVKTTAEAAAPTANKETPKEVTDNSSVKAASVGVKKEPVQLKTELDTAPATFTTWQPLTTTVLEPKTEQISDNTTVVVKIQPPEQGVAEQTTTVAAIESRLTAPDDKREVDDGEVEGGPEHIRKLFVGRVDRRTTHDSLKRYFERWGRIVDICLPIDRFTKRSRGFAFVTFAKARMVDAVQKARPHKVDGRVVDPKRAVPRWESHLPQAKITVRTVFLYNLRGQISEQDLKEYFENFGKVIKCRIIQQRGIGFVEFDDYDPVDKIFLQKVHHICGKSVGADKAMGKQRVAATRNSWNGRMQNGYGSQRWTGVYPRGSQYSRRFQPYYRDNTWRGYGGLANGYRTHTGGGPVRSYYTQRYSPYSNNYSAQRPSLYSTGYYTQRQSPVTSPATWSSNQREGGTDYASVVVNWSTRRDVSSSAQDSSLWGSRGYSTINISHSNTSQAGGERDRTFSGLFTFPTSGTFQTYNYTTARR